MNLSVRFVAGVVTADGRARWAPLVLTDGSPFDGKVEGLELYVEKGAEAGAGQLRAYIVTDRDDPTAPAELCEVELIGPWF